MSRDLSPTEHLILKCVCTGQSNAAIAEKTHYTIKTIENSISRAARVFGVESNHDVNLRVLLALVYVAHFEDVDFHPAQSVNQYLHSL